MIMAGQTINDRLLAAKHSLSGQGLAKSVCKATTEEVLGPKKKHLDYLVHCTNEPNVSIPQLANLLFERSQSASWVVVFKALITTHHLLCYGNERFTQYLASCNCSFQLSNFVDKSGVQGAANIRTGYDMSPFIRRYAKYLNEKSLSYRLVAFDFCKVKRGKEEGTLRSMNVDNLLKTLPVLQAQIDALLEFDCSANDLTNGIINMCFMLLFRDLIRLFACYNDGMINLLEKYFDAMNKKQCREALDLYKKFLIRMDRVAEFLKVAEAIGIDKGDIPDLTKAPNSLLEALESHLAALEGNPLPATQAASQRNIKRDSVTALSSTSHAFNTIDENIKQQAVAEEAAALNQYKQNAAAGGAATNPFLDDEPLVAPQPSKVSNSDILDLFNTPPNAAPAAPVVQSGASKPSDDLLLLGNPFADAFPPADAPVPTGGGATMGQSQIPFATNSVAPQSAPEFDMSAQMWSGVSVNSFPNAMPAMPSQQMQPVVQPVAPAPPKKIITDDLESSLLSLADSLSIGSSNKSAAGQWNSPKNQTKPTTATTTSWSNAAPTVPVVPVVAQANAPTNNTPFDPFGDL